MARIEGQRNHDTDWGVPGQTVVVDPVTGLEFVELSHEWGTHTPFYPGYPDIQIRRVVSHASHGVMSQRIVTVMHHGTHVNAPIHLVQGGAGVGALGIDRFFGSGVVLEIEKGEWELVEPADLEAAGIEVFRGDIVIVNTGWHSRYADSQEYFGEGPGLSKAAADWLIERGVKLVGVDTASVDHPMATSLGRHRGGPIVKALPERYEERRGRRPEDDFPDWNPAHRALLEAGIPTIENVGGDLDHVSGKRCTFQAVPLFWPAGDACIVRLVAILDPSAGYRLEPGDDG
jgi:kynurenine formamidase